MNEIKEPNIFKYATSELSQDAFLCWLIENAKNEYKETELHKFAKLFVSELLDNKISEFEIKNIEKQDKKIDVFIDLEDDKGNKIGVIIEDKTSSYLHDDQILRYVENKKKEDYNKIYVVYFKSRFMSKQEEKDLDKYNEERNKDNSNYIFNIFNNDKINIFFNENGKGIHYLLDQWIYNFDQNYKEIQNTIEYIKNNKYDFHDNSQRKVFLDYREVFLDYIVSEIQNDEELKTKYKDIRWYITDQARTPHIEIYTKNKDIRQYKIGTTLYIMFDKNAYNLSIKQHIFTKDYKRINVRNNGYKNVPSKVIEEKEKIALKLSNVCEWDEQNDTNKRLVIFKKTLNQEINANNIINSLKENKDIDNIIHTLESIE